MVKSTVTAAFPTSVVTDAQLGVHTNIESVTLTDSIETGTTEWTVNDTSALEANMYALIVSGANYELVRIASVDSSTTLTVVREQDGTSAITVDAGRAVRFNTPALTFNQLRAEVQAIQTSLIGGTGELLDVTISSASVGGTPLTLNLPTGSTSKKFIDFQNDGNSVGSIVYDDTNDQLELQNITLTAGSGANMLLEDDRELRLGTDSDGVLKYNSTRDLVLQSGAASWHFRDSGGVYDIVAWGAVGDNVTDDRAAIAAADAAATSAGATLLIPPGTYKLSSNLTLTSAVEFHSGGILAPDAATTLTLNGPITAPETQIFAGAGDIVAPYQSEFWARWYGALGNDAVGSETTNDVALPRAIYSAKNSGRNANVILGSGIFRTSTTLDFDGSNAGIGFIGNYYSSLQQGSTNSSSVIKWVGGASPIISVTGTFHHFANISLQNWGTATTAMSFPSDGSGNTTLYMMSFAIPNGTSAWSTACIESTGTNYMVIDRCFFQSGPCILLSGNTNNTGLKVSHSVFDCGLGTNPMISVTQANGMNILHFANCTFNMVAGTTTVFDNTGMAGTINNLSFTDCEFDGNAGAGFIILAENIEQINFIDCNVEEFPSSTDSLIQLTNSRITVRGLTGRSIPYAFVKTLDTTSYAYIHENYLHLPNTTGMLDVASQSGNLIPVTPSAGVARIKGNLASGMADAVFLVTATTADPFEVQIALPTDGDRGYMVPGQRFSVAVYNNSGGTMGAVTFQAGTTALKDTTFDEPSNGAYTAIDFIWNGTKAIEVGRSIYAGNVKFADLELTGTLSIGGTVLFEDDRDLAVNLVPNADDALTFGSSSRRVGIVHAQDTQARVSAGDANPAMRLRYQGLEFGAGGASAVDVTLHRGGAGLLNVTAASGLNLVDGPFSIGGTTLFESDLDIAVSLIPNATRTLDLGSSTRYFDEAFVRVQGGIINVRGYGAVGDGVTDDTAAIILAAAAVGSGSVLYFPKGTYLISRLGFASFTNVYGNVVANFSSLTDVTVRGDGATIKTVNHDIATYGGLRAFNFTDCHGVTVEGLNFDMTFTGTKDSASYYPFCGAITFTDSAVVGQSATTLSGDVLVQNCRFKLYHPYGSFVTTTNPYAGDSNNGYKLFSVFFSGATDGVLYAQQNRNVTLRNLTLQDGHNGYGFWLWAANNVKVLGCIAEAFVNKSSNTAGVYQSSVIPFIRYHQFHASGLHIEGCYYRAKPSSERTTSGFEGGAIFAVIGTNLDPATYDYDLGEAIVRGNTIIMGAGDLVNGAEDRGLQILTFGSHIIEGNTFDGHHGDTVNTNYGQAILFQGAYGSATALIENNTFGEALRYHDNIQFDTGTNASEDARRYRQVIVKGNTSLAQAQYFFWGHSNTSYTYEGFRQLIIEGNTVSGRNSLWGAGSTNSRGIFVAASEATDTVVITNNSIAEKNIGIQMKTSPATVALHGNVFSGVTTKYSNCLDSVSLINGDLDIVAGVLKLGGTTLFENDRDVAVSLLPNATQTLGLGSATRYWGTAYHGNLYMAPSAGNPTLFAAIVDTTNNGYIIKPTSGLSNASILRVHNSSDTNFFSVEGDGSIKIGGTTVFEANRDVAMHLIPYAAGALNIGSTSQRWVNVYPERVLASGPSYPPVLGERTSSVTGSAFGALQVKHKTTAESVDGFGVNAFFSIEDATSGEINLASIGAVRAGADNTGDFVVSTSNAGTLAERMRIKANGSLDLGGTTLFESDRDLAVSLIPNGDGTLDLGSSSRQFDYAYLNTGLVLGGDVTLSRSGANTLDLASGDSLNIVSGELRIGGTALFESDLDLSVDLIPNATDALDLGSAARRFAEGHVKSLYVGDLSAGITAQATNYTVLAGVTTVLGTGGGGGITITLPAATGSGRLILVKKVDAGAGAVTVDADGAEVIDGATTYSLASQYSAVILQDTASGAWSVF